MTSLKLKFFAWHLIASITVVFTITVICIFVWFPQPFFQIDGTGQALMILAGVDVVIGPLLTLLFVTSKKSTRELLIDIVVILIIQISALSYGLIQIEQERVWAIVHIDGIFMLVTKKEIHPEQLAQNYKLPKFNNIYYAMVLDSELVLNSQESDTVIYYNPKRYHPLTKKGISMVNIIYAKLPIKIRNKYDSSYTFKFLAGKKQDAVVVLNEKVEIIDIMLKPQP